MLNAKFRLLIFKLAMEFLTWDTKNCNIEHCKFYILVLIQANAFVCSLIIMYGLELLYIISLVTIISIFGMQLFFPFVFRRSFNYNLP